MPAVFAVRVCLCDLSELSGAACPATSLRASVLLFLFRDGSSSSSSRASGRLPRSPEARRPGSWASGRLAGWKQTGPLARSSAAEAWSAELLARLHLARCHSNTAPRRKPRSVQCSAAFHGISTLPCCRVPCSAFHSLVLHTALHGTARHGTARHGTALHSTDVNCTRCSVLNHGLLISASVGPNCDLLDLLDTESGS